MPNREYGDLIEQKRINVGAARSKGRGHMEVSAARKWMERQKDKARLRGRKM